MSTHTQWSPVAVVNCIMDDPLLPGSVYRMWCDRQCSRKAFRKCQAQLAYGPGLSTLLSGSCMTWILSLHAFSFASKRAFFATLQTLLRVSANETIGRMGHCNPWQYVPWYADKKQPESAERHVCPKRQNQSPW